MRNPIEGSPANAASSSSPTKGPVCIELTGPSGTREFLSALFDSCVSLKDSGSSVLLDDRLLDLQQVEQLRRPGGG